MQTYSWPWSIFDELERTFFAPAGSAEWPAFDIEDTDDATILTADLPGVSADDIEVTTHGSLLIVRGERKPPRDSRTVRRRRFYGTFERRFQLTPDLYDLDDVKANLHDGVLEIHLAKAARARPRRIKLTTGVMSKVKGLLTSDKEKTAA